MAKNNHFGEILSSLPVPIGHPDFFARVFGQMSKNGRHERAQRRDLLERICKEEYEGITRNLEASQVQDSASVRNNLRTRRLAMTLIDQKGELKLDLLDRAVDCFRRHLYPIGPQRQFDGVRQEHILSVLERFQKSKELRQLLKMISRPFSNRQAEGIIRDTLQLEASTVVTDAHTRMAVLAALLCYLRQNVGSCFATAPAIIVESEQPHMFLTDMRELLATGRLKRTYGGVEYTAPLSSSWGAGDLKKPLLLTHLDPEAMLPLWKSPGLIVAFSTAGLLDEKDTIAHKTKKAKDIILGVLADESKHAHFVLLTCEDILRRALLRQLQLTEQDLVDYANRSKGTVHTGLMLQTPQAAGRMGGKGQICATFVDRFEAAKRAFKALTDNALLKSWEFTVASFAEVKANFSKWNLYTSLGLGPHDQGGIGACLFGIIKQKLDQANAIVQEHQEQCDQVLYHVRYLEDRMRRASTEQEMHSLKVEWQSRAGELHHYEEMRDIAHAKARKWAGLFDILIDAYMEKFPQFFQEVYDADMIDVSTGPYDDSPAGFRLLYKAGRAASAQWARITNPAEFIDALAGFFVMTENELSQQQQFQEISSDMGEIVTAIVNHVRTKEFLETAFDRMAIAHGVRPVANPLDNLDKIEKKPWVYTSGGTMNTLVASYYSREDSPTEVGRWVESEQELLAFLIDTLKQLPPKISQQYQNGEHRSLLIHSPTHAFLLQPNRTPFRDAWTESTYTYTWIKDSYVVPRQRFVDDIILDKSMMQEIIEQLTHKVPRSHHHQFGRAFAHLPPRLSSIDFRDHIVDTLSQDRSLRMGGHLILDIDEVDSMLYAKVPFFPAYKLRERVEEVFRQMPLVSDTDVSDLMSFYDRSITMSGGMSVGSADLLRDTCLALLLVHMHSTHYSKDLYKEVTIAMQQLGFAMPAPVIFADTNWVKDYFSLLISPGTGKLELWRTDAYGSFGTPMSAWKQWVDGSRRDRTWGVYVNPIEYRR